MKGSESGLVWTDCSSRTANRSEAKSRAGAGCGILNGGGGGGGRGGGLQDRSISFLGNMTTMNT